MFQNGVDLKQYSNYKIGGSARQFCNPKNVEEIIRCLDSWRKSHSCVPIRIAGAPHRGAEAGCSHTFILGGGTNLLINDKGFDGLVLKPEIKKLEIVKLGKKDARVKVGASVQVSELLNYLITKSLSGLEWAGGLPGTVGGAIRGNAGAFGGEMKDSIVEAVSLDISGNPPAGGPKIIKRGNAQCQFGYRDSIYKMDDGREIILEATLLLKKGDSKAIAKAIEEKIKYRKERQPLEYPNIGSIFKNVPLAQICAENTRKYAESLRNSTFSLRGSALPVKNDPFPVVPTAHLISECGLKGVSWGGAMISPKHPNFIVNVLDAKSEDVKTLIKLVKTAVKEKFGVKLEEEIIYV